MKFFLLNLVPFTSKSDLSKFQVIKYLNYGENLEIPVPKGTPRFPKRRTLANILSKAANLQQSVDEFMTEEYVQFLEFLPEINRLARLYADYKRTNQLMDYDDLILNFRQLLGQSE